MAGSVVTAEVSAASLSVDSLLAAATTPQVGGVGLFVGVVRDHNDGQHVTGLDYEAHPAAAQALRVCAERVADEFDVVRVAVGHRVGRVEVGEVAVVAAVGAEHRGDAMDACRALIEAVKAEVPIWKREHLVGGGTVWVGS